MDFIDLVRDVSTELIVAVITFVLGVLVSKVPSSLDKYRLRRFFGTEFSSDQFKIVYGLFQRTEDESRRRIAVYEKTYSNETKYEVSPPPYWITTPDSVRGIAHFAQEFSKYRKKPFIISADKEALSYLHESTFLCVGGPIANEISSIALEQETNKGLRFSLPSEKRGYATIESISDRKRFDRPNEIGHDYGIIAKVRNPLSVMERYFFVCAGIGSLGTSAALWYLSHYWRQLYQEFHTKEFGIVIEVTSGRDNISKRVYPRAHS